MEADFISSQESVFFIFGVLKLSFFMRQLPKRQMESWAQQPTSIIDHLRYTYHLSFRRANLRRYILNFAQASAYFAGSGAKSGITNSKKRKMQDLCVESLNATNLQGKILMCIHIGFLVVIVQITAVLALEIQKRYDSSGGNPKQGQN
jgi:hypothetical protein